ncbi:hypothetical protein [Sphingomonas bacterium]|uniref:hypothetical protein n=1 Tax=Sphingomonas bacterium TaxID=1895847 RepID=UPI0015769A02|nr:hypothetical protein [Sphingomonas bacterium]
MTTLTILPLLLALAGTASAQQAPAPVAVPTAPDADIVVQHRTDAAIARMVDAMTQTRHGFQVARWNEAICPLVLDLDPLHTALIDERIVAVAKSVDVPVATKPCAPSVVIVATADADALAKALVDQHPGLFGDPAYGIRHGNTITDLKASRPVRWINATRTGGADSRRIGAGNALNTYNGGSRIAHTTRENTVLSLVIVDTARLSHITWGQLADYLSLVTLANPALSVAAPDSVMSIFATRDAGGRGPAGLTPADTALLQGLYRSDSSLGSGMQRAQIADQIKKARKP